MVRVMVKVKAKGNGKVKGYLYRATWLNNDRIGIGIGTGIGNRIGIGTK